MFITLLRSDLRRANYLLVAFAVTGLVGLAWLGKQSDSVYQLTRGVGGTWF